MQNLLYIIYYNLHKKETKEKMDKLTNHTNSGTFDHMFAEYLEANPNRNISKRELEKYSVFIYMTSLITYPITFNNKKEHLDAMKNAPGDIQRNLRNFFDKFNRYGVERYGERSSTTYKYTPITENRARSVQPSIARNIFKTDTERDAFAMKNNHTCELTGVRCGRTSDPIIAQVDHGRAYSTYQIDDERIAVYLSEAANMKHSNKDLSIVLKDHSSDTKVINNWINIETRLRDVCTPNDEDKRTQNEMIEHCIHTLGEDASASLIQKLLQMKHE